MLSGGSYQLDVGWESYVIYTSSKGKWKEALLMVTLREGHLINKIIEHKTKTKCCACHMLLCMLP